MRLLLAGMTAVALIGPAAVAAAEPCVCLTGTEALTAPALVDAPFSEPTMGADALSRPVEELISPPLFLVVGEGQVPSPEQVLWCEGSDDPRCSPAHDGPIAPELRAPPPAASGADRVVPRARGLTTIPAPIEGLGAARGVSRALDRPPRVAH